MLYDFLIDTGITLKNNIKIASGNLKSFKKYRIENT